VAENVYFQSPIPAPAQPDSAPAAPSVGLTLIKAVLQPYIKAGLLDENLMPLVKTKGEKGMLAHHIAQRLNLKIYWPLFAEIWDEKYLRTYYNSYISTKKSSVFLKKLNML